MLIVEVTREEAEQMKKALVGFVTRVSSESRSATPEELAALPKIASLLLDSNG